MNIRTALSELETAVALSIAPRISGLMYAREVPQGGGVHGFLGFGKTSPVMQSMCMSSQICERPGGATLNETSE